LKNMSSEFSRSLRELVGPPSVLVELYLSGWLGFEMGRTRIRSCLRLLKPGTEFHDIERLLLLRQVLPPPSLCQNCAKTLSNCDAGAYFEREADSPKLLETLESESKERNRWNAGSCLQSRCSLCETTFCPAQRAGSTTQCSYADGFSSFLQDEWGFLLVCADSATISATTRNACRACYTGLGRC